MEYNQSYNLDVVLSKFECITSFFQIIWDAVGLANSNAMLTLMEGICGATADAAAFWVDGSVGCVSVQAEGDV